MSLLAAWVIMMAIALLFVIAAAIVCLVDAVMKRFGFDREDSYTD